MCLPRPPSAGSWADTFSLDFWIPDPTRIHPRCPKLPSLWSFVTAAIGKCLTPFPLLSPFPFSFLGGRRDWPMQAAQEVASVFGAEHAGKPSCGCVPCGAWGRGAAPHRRRRETAMQNRGRLE